jgi:7,8-dihydropterin-6-yl-methyl-4-(beta-D-ribofuranosyl)aminobenzene 5'-phosphate synthase
MRWSFLFTTVMVLASWARAEVEIRIIYDNTSARAGVQEDWGFAAVVTVDGERILFDSGTKPALFLENLKKLGVEPQSIRTAMISHQHGDHRNGIYELYPAHPGLPVHFLKTFEPAAWEAAARIGMKPVAVGDAPLRIASKVWTTGRVAGEPDEQAMVVETRKGLVVMVGCSHPGVVKMVEAAERQRGRDSVYLLLGGFHMFRQNETQIAEQIEQLKKLKVERIRPAHCTGELAHGMFQKAWGNRYGTAGAGNIIQVD